MSYYSVQCTQKGCRYGCRSFGSAPLTAKTKGTAHALRRQHVVVIWQTDPESLTSTVIEEISPQKVSQPFDNPPF